MSTLTRFGLATALLVTLVLMPSQAQTPGTAKVSPKLDPIAETRLLMEGLAHPNFRGIERQLAKKEIDDQSWVFARGQALLIAETANLLMLRPPKTAGAQPIWFDNATELRRQATTLAQHLGKKDLERSKAGMVQLANSCNRCHQAFRVPVDIAPTPPGEAAPIRKVSIGNEIRW